MFTKPTYGQMISVVEIYLLKKTGKEIKINMPRNVGEIKKLAQMYYFIQNNK
jgi:hypothetical protein